MKPSIKRWFLIPLLGAVFVAGWIGARLVGPRHDHAAEGKPGQIWTCSMDPQIKQPGPGKCPLCGMDLIPLEQGPKDPGQRRIAMTKGAIKLAEIETSRVRRREALVTVRLVGKVDYDERRQKVLSARFAGRLDRLFVDYTGVPVRPGEHLFEIYSPELLTAQEELLQSLSDWRGIAQEGPEKERAAATLAAARQKLVLWGLTPEQVAEVERKRATTRRLVIYAPIGGIVITKHAVEGAYVKEGTPIYTIADLSHVWVLLDAYEMDLGWMGLGQQVELEAEAYPGRRFKGRISFIDPVLNEKTRTVRVRVSLPNPDGRLMPGMFVHAVIHAKVSAAGQAYDDALSGKWLCPMHPEHVADEQGSCPICGMALVPSEKLSRVLAPRGEQPLVVPRSAVLLTGKRAVVYVKLPKQAEPVFEGREIVVGALAGDVYVVLAGLAEDEEVVTKGAFKLDSAMQIQAKPSMMSPPAERGPAPKPEKLPGAKRFEGDGAFRQQLAPAYRAYFALQRALAGDALHDAHTAAAALGPALAELRSAELPESARSYVRAIGAALAPAVERAKAAADLAAARAAFGRISQGMTLLEHGFGHAGDQTFHELFCPMAFDNKGARWLQTDKPTHNPYFGKSMPTCGAVERSFPPRKVVGGALRVLVRGYLALAARLAADDDKGAAVAAHALVAAAARVEAPANVRQGAGRVHDATTIAARRAAFADLSAKVIELVRKAGLGPLHRVHCSMAQGGKGADWLQADKAVKNPYYGASMLQCGDVVETLGQGR